MVSINSYKNIYNFRASGILEEARVVKRDIMRLVVLPAAILTLITIFISLLRFMRPSEWNLIIGNSPQNNNHYNNNISRQHSPAHDYHSISGLAPQIVRYLHARVI